MSTNEELTHVGNHTVVSLEYTLTVNGVLIDTSESNQPLEYIQGQGQIIPGLERAVYGMAIGESKQLLVPFSEGYGKENPEAFADLPRADFPPSIPLNPGVKLQVKTNEGKKVQARIESIEQDTVRLNFNHPLAGKDLDFSIKVLGLRTASAQELESGEIEPAAGDQ